MARALRLGSAGAVGIVMYASEPATSLVSAMIGGTSPTRWSTSMRSEIYWYGARVARACVVAAGALNG